MAAVRKKFICHCGCRGWRTHFSMFNLTAWSLRHLLEYVWPEDRHDGTPSIDCGAQPTRASWPSIEWQSNSDLCRMDCMELATAARLPTMSDALRPCFACNACGRRYLPGSWLELGRWPFPGERGGELVCRLCVLRDLGRGAPTLTWRRESHARHRNPIFDQKHGTAPVTRFTRCSWER